MPVLTEFTYVFAIGTFFALMEAYNNGANDVANAWATSVSSRSISYRQAMVLGTIFELTGAIAVGARTAETIKNGIIPNDAFRGDPGVQMLAFTCALAAASSWVMWCTRHSTHVSSTYSLVSAVAGVGVATAGADKVQWGWNNGKGLGAIFAGLGMAPTIAAFFGAAIFMSIKLAVHLRRNPVFWAIWTSPFFFLVAGTICTLSIVYKGSPALGLNKKPGEFVAGVTMGTGFSLALLAALFFVPYVHAQVVKRDGTLRWYHVFVGPLNFARPPQPPGAKQVRIPNYAVVQHFEEEDNEVAQKKVHSSSSSVVTLPELSFVSERQAMAGKVANREPIAVAAEVSQKTYQEIMAEGQARFHARLYKKKGALGWAMRYLRDNPMHAGEIYEWRNMKRAVSRVPAMITVAALYGVNYDIHAAQSGIEGTPEGERMARVYGHAKKYPNEVEHLYSFVQIITACTASFAHGANDIGNSVGPWAVIFAAWNTGSPTASTAEVPIWQLAVLALTISLGLCTYGYNIMKVMGNKITYHSPSRGSSMEMGAAVTVLIFSQYSLPVSTSMCITGATVGVGLCNGSWKAVNWQRVGLLVISWIATIPIAGTLAGVLMGIVLYAPHFRG